MSNSCRDPVNAALCMISHIYLNQRSEVFIVQAVNNTKANDLLNAELKS